MKIQGKLNYAEIFTDYVDEQAMSQIYQLLANPAAEGSKIAIMPDVHAGRGSIVGLTMTFGNLIIPSIVGVDIGCGVFAVNLGLQQPNLDRFDKFIRKNLPSGKEVHSEPRSDLFSPSKDLEHLVEKVCPGDYQRIMCSMGSLGGGNHFLELDRDPGGNIWLLIHSGSRNLGLKVCDYHVSRAKEWIRKEFRGAGAWHQMEYIHIDEGGRDYLDDMKITQEFAYNNRKVMAEIIVSEFFKLNIKKLETISSIHNYYNFNDNTVRKGAISAHCNEKLVIPLNMRDGAIFGTGKGIAEWNFSAPHGAGRKFSRGKAKEVISLKAYRESMKGIFSSCIDTSTLDESPLAYKKSDHIIKATEESVNIDFIAKPIWNFKSSF